MAKNVATETKHVCCYHNGERNRRRRAAAWAPEREARDPARARGEQRKRVHVPDRSNRRITLRYPYKCELARRRRVSREFLCACVGSRASTDAVLPRVHRSVGPGSGSLNVCADVQGAGSWMDTLRHTIRCRNAVEARRRRRFSRLARQRPTLRCGANTEAWSFGCIWIARSIT